MLRMLSTTRTLRYGLVPLLALALLGLLAPGGRPGSAAAQAPATPPPTDTVQYFAQTSHLVRGPLLTFFLANGGPARFGAPLTEEWTEGTHTYQIFEQGGLLSDTQTGAVGAWALGAELIAGYPVAPPVAAPAPGAGGLFVVETGHTVGAVFVPYWQGSNGAARLGKPTTELLTEGDRATQYFEFARLTVDATAPGGVRERLQDNVRSAGSPFAPAAPLKDPTALFVAATGHSLTGGFRDLYTALGGAAAFGAPLTDEVTENGLTVQYFQAGKLSWAASRPAGQQVQVEAIGREWLAGHTVPAAALQPAAAPPATPVPTQAPAATAVPPTTTVSLTPVLTSTATVTTTLPAAPSVTPQVPITPSATPVPPSIPGVPAGWQLVGRGTTYFKGSSQARITNITVASRKLDGVTVPAGAVFSFNNSLGDDSEKAGFVEGLIIFNGRTIPGVGGGICQVASTFFRAAFNSGFPILERHPHSYRVSWYEPPVGFDATVFRDEGVDLRWRNNLSAPVLIHTYLDRGAGTLTVSVYSRAQQTFTVSLDGPYTSNKIAHGPALYEDDPKLAAGTLTQVEHAKDGLDAVIYRVTTDKATGKVIGREKFFSRYSPWRDVYKRGTKTTAQTP